MILVKLNSACDVTVLFANMRKLSTTPGISIRPDLTPSEKATQDIQLKERRSLISSGSTNSRDIRLNKNSLYIGSTIHGQVINKLYVPSSSMPPSTADSSNVIYHHGPNMNTEYTPQTTVPTTSPTNAPHAPLNPSDLPIPNPPDHETSANRSFQELGPPS